MRGNGLVSAAACWIAVCAFAGVSPAGDTLWVHDPASPGDWFSASNWWAGVPGLGDYAHIDNGGTAVIAGGSAQALGVMVGESNAGHIAHWAGSADVPNLFVALNLASTGSYELSGTGVLTTSSVAVGLLGAGQFAQTGGTHVVDDFMGIATQAGGFGTYHLAGGLLSVQNEAIGNGGTGIFVQTGGTHQSATVVTIGNVAGSSGRYELHDGAFSVTDWEGIGVDGVGRFIQSGGTNAAGGMGVGANAGGDGAYQLGNGDLTIGAYLTVGHECRGAFTQTGGSVHVGDGMTVGGASTGNGTYELTGGSLSVTNWQTIGYAGTGAFVQSGGTSNSGGFTLGGNAGGNGTYTMSDGSLVAAWEAIGQGGVGTFIQTGGTHQSLNVLAIGNGGGGRGAYELRGGELTAQWESVGNRSIGTFTHTGGSHTADTLCLGRYAGGDGTYELSGAGVLNAQVLSVGTDGTGHFIQAGGTVGVGSLGIWASVGGAGVYDLSGGSLTAEQVRVGFGAGGPGRFNLSGGNVDADYLGVVEYGWGTGIVNQTAGAGTLGFLQVGGGGTYRYTGGSLLIKRGAALAGSLDFADSAAEMRAGDSTLLNFTQGSLLNTGNAALVVGADSLCIFPAGFDPYAAFARFETGGMVHNAGSTLVVHAGEGFGGAGQIEDHVECFGAIEAARGGPGSGWGIQLLGGLMVQPGAVVDLGEWGAGGVHVTDESSGMNGGRLMASYMHIGPYGDTGRFVQTDGQTWIGGGLWIGSGTYRQTGGNVQVWGEISLGVYAGSTGRYELADNAFLGGWPGNLVVGRGGTGEFVQQGGSNGVRALWLGWYRGSAGTYTISSGYVYTEDVCVGNEGAGTFVIDGPEADITVTGLLRFGVRGAFSAVPGSTIDLSGASLANYSTNPDALAGLSNLSLAVSGNPAYGISALEVAGADLGPTDDGWVSNFALGVLILGPGHARLVDDVDNRPAWAGKEALYVDWLAFSGGGAVDLNPNPPDPENCLNLYYRNGGEPKQFFLGDADLNGAVQFLDYQILEQHFGQSGRTWFNGDFNGDWLVNFADYQILEQNFGRSTPGLLGEPIPEPASLSVLALGVLALVGRRRA